MPVFNQLFIPSWNAIYSNLINKIALSIINSNVYNSPFSQMLQNMETGNYIEEIHINPGSVMLNDTITNSDIFSDYTDDIVTSYHTVNVDLQFPSTYVEYVVRTGFSLINNVTALISALTANIRTTIEFWRNNLVKQMLYNAYQYGMISADTIANPLASAANSGRLAVTINNIIDDFRTELNTRNVIYNNQVGITNDEKRYTIGKEFPYVIIFNEFVRDVEFMNAINLGLIERFNSGNSNMDWQNRLIFLNRDDFPKAIPPINRSSVIGSNVSAENINFYEPPKKPDGTLIYSGTPLGGDTLIGFVIEPDVIKLVTQLDIMTAWLNPATLKNTNRAIYRTIMDLSAFGKIRAITYNA